MAILEFVSAWSFKMRPVLSNAAHANNVLFTDAMSPFELQSSTEKLQLIWPFELQSAKEKMQEKLQLIWP